MKPDRFLFEVLAANGKQRDAKQGCINQADQGLHGVLSPGNTSPSLAPNETTVILSPVRMKPNHPSLTLSSTARIHYSRAYGISHAIPVQPLS